MKDLAMGKMFMKQKSNADDPMMEGRGFDAAV